MKIRNLVRNVCHVIWTSNKQQSLVPSWGLNLSQISCSQFREHLFLKVKSVLYQEQLLQNRTQLGHLHFGTWKEPLHILVNEFAFGVKHRRKLTFASAMATYIVWSDPSLLHTFRQNTTAIFSTATYFPNIIPCGVLIFRSEPVWVGRGTYVYIAEPLLGPLRGDVHHTVGLVGNTQVPAQHREFSETLPPVTTELVAKVPVVG